MNQWDTRNFPITTFNDTKYEIIKKMKKELQRKLKVCEKQMIMHAKSCLICNRRDSLRTCMGCFTSNYCNDHEVQFQKSHEADCKELKLCLDLDLNLLQESFTQFQIPNIKSFPNVQIPILKMDDFVTQYMKRGRLGVDWTYDHYYYSDWMSGPLTLFFGLKDTLLLPEAKSNVYTVHIINSYHVDRIYFQTWELLLHLLPHIKILTIVMVEPGIEYIKRKCKTCIHCFLDSRELHFECYSMFYEIYASDSMYKKPNVIVAFEVNKGNYNVVSVNLIRAIRARTCPLFLTVMSSKISHYVKKKMKEDMSPLVVPVHNFSNRFSSRRPYRDMSYQNGLHVAYRNKYVIICAALKSALELPQASVSSSQ
ncbi:PREDICTED: uncharacterized protein LOC106744659 [Dinoponera quadriceps]|uniref:Uncharacterized protein LOC106744659 n=1 Tax=Dinoponera quadriceps TaxID=609295 RepID=A0A6P3X9Z6_DINQU|nr:PREDICTED: uncharacterized protein LOC106744659 [Dinoponera quadriceps]